MEEELGTCPAAIDKSHHGINGGVNAGRICWLVSGTFCGGAVTGTLAIKTESCMQCEFLQTVLDEEGVNFRLRVREEIKSNTTT